MSTPSVVGDARLTLIERERERCAGICDALATQWEAGASRIRTEGSFNTRSIWPPFRKITVVAPRFEQVARDIEGAAGGVRSIAALIRNGATLPEASSKHARSMP